MNLNHYKNLNFERLYFCCCKKYFLGLRKQKGLREEIPKRPFRNILTNAPIKSITKHQEVRLKNLWFRTVAFFGNPSRGDSVVEFQ